MTPPTTKSDKAPVAKAADAPAADAPPAEPTTPEPEQAEATEVEPVTAEAPVFENTEIDGVRVGEFVGVDDCYKNYASIHGAPLAPADGE